MSKYKAQFKEEVIKHYLSGKDGYVGTGERFGVDGGTVQKWVAAYRYHGEASTKVKYIHYKAEFKETVLKHMRLHDLSYRETAARFDIRSRSALVCWELAYNLEG